MLRNPLQSAAFSKLAFSPMGMLIISLLIRWRSGAPNPVPPVRGFIYLCLRRGNIIITTVVVVFDLGTGRHLHAERERQKTRLQFDHWEITAPGWRLSLSIFKYPMRAHLWARIGYLNMEMLIRQPGAVISGSSGIP